MAGRVGRRFRRGGRPRSRTEDEEEVRLWEAMGGLTVEGCGWWESCGLYGKGCGRKGGRWEVGVQKVGVRKVDWAVCRPDSPLSDDTCGLHTLYAIGQSLFRYRTYNVENDKARRSSSEIPRAFHECT